MVDWAEEMRYVEKIMDLIDGYHALQQKSWGDLSIDEQLGCDLLQGYLTTRCDECGLEVGEMSERHRVLHRMYKDWVMVCCEGYWVFPPKFVSDDMAERYPNWSDWTELTDAEIEDEIDAGVREQDIIDRTTEEPDWEGE